MAAIDWTASRPNLIDFKIFYQNRSFRADSGRVSAIEYGRPFWQADLTFENLARGEERALTAMLGKLRGIYGTIKVPAWTRFRDDDKGLIVTNIANVDAMSITVAANYATSQKIFSAGDYISFANEMFEVTDDVTSLSNGSATVPLNKRLRNTYPANTPIEYKRPFCIMRLAEDELSVSIRPVFANLSVTLTEAF
jgi:hypothetical protein